MEVVKDSVSPVVSEICAPIASDPLAPKGLSYPWCTKRPKSPIATSQSLASEDSPTTATIHERGRQRQRTVCTIPSNMREPEGQAETSVSAFPNLSKLSMNCGSTPTTCHAEDEVFSKSYSTHTFDKPASEVSDAVAAPERDTAPGASSVATPSPTPHEQSPTHSVPSTEGEVSPGEQTRNPWGEAPSPLQPPRYRSPGYPSSESYHSSTVTAVPMYIRQIFDAPDGDTSAESLTPPVSPATASNCWKGVLMVDAVSSAPGPPSFGSMISTATEYPLPSGTVKLRDMVRPHSGDAQAKATKPRPSMGNLAACQATRHESGDTHISRDISSQSNIRDARDFNIQDPAGLRSSNKVAAAATHMVQSSSVWRLESPTSTPPGIAPEASPVSSTPPLASSSPSALCGGASTVRSPFDSALPPANWQGQESHSRRHVARNPPPTSPTMGVPKTQPGTGGCTQMADASDCTRRTLAIEVDDAENPNSKSSHKPPRGLDRAPPGTTAQIYAGVPGYAHTPAHSFLSQDASFLTSTSQRSSMCTSQLPASHRSSGGLVPSRSVRGVGGGDCGYPLYPDQSPFSDRQAAPLVPAHNRSELLTRNGLLYPYSCSRDHGSALDVVSAHSGYLPPGMTPHGITPRDCGGNFEAYGRHRMQTPMESGMRRGYGSPLLESGQGGSKRANIGGRRNRAQLPSPPGLWSKDVTPYLNDLRGRVVGLAKIQAGSRFLQRQLCKGNPDIVLLILEEVESDITALMTDAYGNYLCQQLFQACNLQQRRRMLEKLASHVVSISCDRRGTHSLQALIGLLSTADEEAILIREVRGRVVELATDPNGTHVVQRILVCFTPPTTDWVFDPVIIHMKEVAQSPHGLCVVKRLISAAAKSSTYHDRILEQLSIHALDLVQSPYGNYAIQHALETWGGEQCGPIFDQLKGRMLSLSTQKFSSNVVEKCIQTAPKEIRNQFIEELTDADKMAVLIQSYYGNYVVQRALDHVNHIQALALQKAIQRNFHRTVSSRPIRQKWERILQLTFNRAQPSVAAADRDNADPKQKISEHEIDTRKDDSIGNRMTNTHDDSTNINCGFRLSLGGATDLEASRWAPPDDASQKLEQPGDMAAMANQPHSVSRGLTYLEAILGQNEVDVGYHTAAGVPLYGAAGRHLPRTELATPRSCPQMPSTRVDRAKAGFASMPSTADDLNPPNRKSHLGYARRRRRHRRRPTMGEPYQSLPSVPAATVRNFEEAKHFSEGNTNP